MPTVLENLQFGLQLIQAEPEQMLNLSTWAIKKTCGTLHCGAGLLGTHKYFQEQGIELLWTQQDGFEMIGVSAWRGSMAADRVFGRNAYDRLFAPHGLSPLDESAPVGSSDKDLLIWRFNCAIDAELANHTDES